MEVILYSSNCPKCNILEKKLRQANIDFTLVQDVDLMIAKGFMSAPMLEVDGQAMDFGQANNWIKEQE